MALEIEPPWMRRAPADDADSALLVVADAGHRQRDFFGRDIQALAKGRLVGLADRRHFRWHVFGVLRLLQFVLGLLGGELDAGSGGDRGGVVFREPRFIAGQFGGDALLGLDGRFDRRAVALVGNHRVAMNDGQNRRSGGGRRCCHLADLVAGSKHLEVAAKLLFVADGDEESLDRFLAQLARHGKEPRRAFFVESFLRTRFLLERIQQVRRRYLHRLGKFLYLLGGRADMVHRAPG